MPNKVSATHGRNAGRRSANIKKIAPAKIPAEVALAVPPRRFLGNGGRVGLSHFLDLTQEIGQQLVEVQHRLSPFEKAVEVFITSGFNSAGVYQAPSQVRSAKQKIPAKRSNGETQLSENRTAALIGMNRALLELGESFLKTPAKFTLFRPLAQLISMAACFPWTPPTRRQKPYFLALQSAATAQEILGISVDFDRYLTAHSHVAGLIVRDLLPTPDVVVEAFGTAGNNYRVDVSDLPLKKLPHTTLSVLGMVLLDLRSMQRRLQFLNQ